MPEEVTRQEFTESMRRIHTRIDCINASSIRMEESSKRIEISVDKVCKEMDGNGRDGIKTKVSNIFTVLKIHFWLLSLVFVGLLGIAYFVIRKGIA